MVFCIRVQSFTSDSWSALLEHYNETKQFKDFYTKVKGGFRRKPEKYGLSQELNVDRQELVIRCGADLKHRKLFEKQVRKCMELKGCSREEWGVLYE